MNRTNSTGSTTSLPCTPICLSGSGYPVDSVLFAPFVFVRLLVFVQLLASGHSVDPVLFVLFMCLVRMSGWLPAARDPVYHVLFCSCVLSVCLSHECQRMFKGSATAQLKYSIA